MKLLSILLMPWHLLTWSDFKGTPSSDKTIAAMSRITIQWMWSEDQDGDITVSASVFFDPSMSFTRTKKPNVLKHEQGHMDICKIVCNRINKDYAHIKVTEQELVDLKALYEKMWDTIDAQYDLETDGSRNHEQQEVWNKWIQEQLKP